MTATWQMVGVQSMGSAPGQAELVGWSSELKVSLAGGSGRPRGAPCHVEAVPTRRTNDLMWWLEGGACEPPRRAATTEGAGATGWVRKRPRGSSQEATGKC